MNALVAYNSSSDEDENEHAVTQNVVNERDARVAHESAGEAESGPVELSSNAAMVGPQIPSNMMQSYEEDDNGDDLDRPTSERDMIRYLTQATHPMTEMPPSPPGSPNDAVADRFKHFLELKSKGVHFNEDLARKSAFKNPTLLSTLMNRAGLDDQSAYRTSLPVSVFEAKSLSPAGFKEALLKNQQTIKAQEDAEKKTLAGTGKRILEFTPGSISTTSSASSSLGGLQKRRKS